MIGLRQKISVLRPGKDENWVDVGIDAGVAVVSAVVITEVLRSLIGKADLLQEVFTCVKARSGCVAASEIADMMNEAQNHSQLGSRDQSRRL